MDKVIPGPFHLGKNLTTTHLQHFHKYGFIQFKNFIDKDTLGVFLREIKSVEQHLLSKGISKVNGIPLKFGHDTDGSPLIQRIAFASHYSPVLKNFLKDARLQVLTRLLGNYEGRIGEDEKDGLVVNHYVNAGTSAFKQLVWHTDSPRDLFLGSR
ncbi:MAG: phytanoyl-CoA dioxygenase, partial [Chitinophaga rupis]